MSTLQNHLGRQWYKLKNQAGFSCPQWPQYDTLFQTTIPPISYPLKRLHRFPGVFSSLFMCPFGFRYVPRVLFQCISFSNGLPPERLDLEVVPRWLPFPPNMCLEYKGMIQKLIKCQTTILCLAIPSSLRCFQKGIRFAEGRGKRGTSPFPAFKIKLWAWANVIERLQFQKGMNWIAGGGRKRRAFTLLQDVTIMHRNGCRVRRSTVEHQPCGPPVGKAGQPES